MNMKRILCLFFAIACFFVVEAKHFEFMGIPINGTITNFQQKLKAKGFTYDAKERKTAPADMRAYRGTFSGKKCQLAVKYNVRTKQVYGVIVIIESSTWDGVRSNYNYFVRLFDEKYASNSEAEDIDDGIRYMVYDNNSSVVGIVGLQGNESKYGKRLLISYMDMENTRKNDQDEINGL